MKKYITLYVSPNLFKASRILKAKKSDASLYFVDLVKTALPGVQYYGCRGEMYSFGFNNTELYDDQIRYMLAKALEVLKLKKLNEMIRVEIETKDDLGTQPTGRHSSNDFSDLGTQKSNDIQSLAPDNTSGNISLAPNNEPQPEDESASQSIAPDPSAPSLVTAVNEASAMRTELLKHVKGQVHAVNKVVSTLFSSKVYTATGAGKGKPRATFVFAGPSGTGKTMLSKLTAEIMKLPTMLFSMTGFSSGDSGTVKFAGIGKSYKDAHEGEVTGFVEKNNRCVLIFDEIEKADLMVHNLFLQILEEGVCFDNFLERNVSFENAIIIMTTNAGKPLYDEGDKRNFSDVSDDVVLDAIRSDVNKYNQPLLPIPLVSRMSECTVIMFNHIESHILRDLIQGEMSKNIERYSKTYNLDITLNPDVAAAVLYSMGGSPDVRTLKGKAKNIVDNELLALFNQIKAMGGSDGLSKVKNISLSIDLENTTDDVKQLFTYTKTPKVLVFGEMEVTRRMMVGDLQIDFLFTPNLDEGKAFARKDIAFALIDVKCAPQTMSYTPTDLEDFASQGNDFFRYMREYYAEVPVYVLNTDVDKYNEDDFRTYMGAGAHGVIHLSDDESIATQLNDTARNVLMSSKTFALLKSCKALAYNCAQIIAEDATCAEVKLASLHLRRNIVAQDSGSILSATAIPDVRFDDIIGSKDAKDTMQSFIKYLNNPKEYLATGARAPRGVLLYGPPGTGKTLLAKAMAGEAGVTFIQKNATEFFNEYSGVGPRLVRDVFKLARKYAPSIIFVDEIDAIGKMRTGSESGQAAEQLLTTFLSELDGFVFDEKRPVLLLAATNYSIAGESSGDRKVLDPAFVRRFDRKIKIDLPNTEDRKKFIIFYLKKHGINYISDETISNVALRTYGKSPADLEMMIEFAIRLMEGAPLTEKVLTQAVDADNYGQEKKWSEEVMLNTSYHEAGHTIISWLSGERPTFVTNISRGGFGGYMLPEIDDNKFGYTKQELLNKICCAMGGRAAEVVFYGPEKGNSTGPSSDLRQATSYAKQLFLYYGMDDNLVVADPDEYGSEVGKMMYNKLNSILREQLNRAIELITKYKDATQALTDELMKKNSLTKQEIADLLIPLLGDNR